MDKCKKQPDIDITEAETGRKRSGLDLIRRQDAIDAIHCDITVTGRQNAELVAATIGTFADRIKALPSAESEIIRCKDCKHMIINEKHEAKPMICCFTKMCGTTEPDWFCADGERRDDERLN